MDNIQTPTVLADQYRLMELLGEGSNGKTWLARDLIHGERVAIKALKLSQVENFKTLELFQRESEVLASITVLGVPKFYAAISDIEHSGQAYIIQQYIDAPSIQSYLDNGRIFTETEVLLLMGKVADILHVLETKYAPPIIHRDIKPSNILCTMPDPAANILDFELTPWLIDFGAVANPQKREGGSTIAGTYGYMSPEQLMGENVVQADYYALGATALHMLTGKPPYEIETDCFKLNFRPAIQELAPNTSPHMLMLLDCLLATNHEDRPKDSLTLKTCIQNVAQGLEPNASTAIKKLTFRQRILACCKQNFSMLNPMQHSQDEVTGYITNLRSVANTRYAEYTYVVDDIYFTNLHVISQNLYDYLCTQPFPVQCNVRYDTHVRGYSKIISFAC